MVVVVVVHDYCIVGGVDGVEMIIIMSMMIVEIGRASCRERVL